MHISMSYMIYDTLSDKKQNLCFGLYIKALALEISW